jgi:hypothetical protein
MRVARRLLTREAVRQYCPFFGAFIVALSSLGCGGLPSDARERPSTCVVPDGATGAPSTIADAVYLANALLASHADGVTIDCFVESLDRPLGVLATNSIFSAQPAAGPRSPRIFLFSGNIVMSIAPEGIGSQALEVAEYTAPLRSIKGEIEFPLHAALAPSSPYDRIRYMNGTLCAGCHGPEEPAPSVTFATAFESDVIRPRAQELVSIDYLGQEAKTCDPAKEPYRCAMLRSVVGHGALVQRSFPAQARTIYGSE